MPLASFLILSSLEQGEAKHLRDYIKNLDIKKEDSYEKILSLSDRLNSSDKVRLSEIIQAMDLSMLIRLALTEPQIDAICQLPILNEIWENRWRQAGRNPREKAEKNHRPIQEFLPQPNLSTFTLLKGIFMYSQYVIHNKERVDPDEPLEFLMQAAKLGCFFALNELCAAFLENNNPSKAFFYASRAAELHWAPGYLLLAIVCFASKNYSDALLNLIIAEKLTPHSQAAINNAYHGKTLSEVSLHILKKFNSNTWDEVKVQLAKLANVSLPFVVSTLYPQAQKQVDALLLDSVMVNSEPDTASKHPPASLAP